MKRLLIEFEITTITLHKKANSIFHLLNGFTIFVA